MIGKGATPSFFSIANYNYTLTLEWFLSDTRYWLGKSPFELTMNMLFVELFVKLKLKRIR